MRTKEERRSLHRSEIIAHKSVGHINKSLSRSSYTTGKSGMYKNIKVNGSDFYVKLTTDIK